MIFSFVLKQNLGKCSAKVLYQKKTSKPMINITCTDNRDADQIKKDDYNLYTKLKGTSWAWNLFHNQPGLHASPLINQFLDPHNTLSNEFTQQSGFAECTKLEKQIEATLTNQI